MNTIAPPSAPLGESAIRANCPRVRFGDVVVVGSGLVDPQNEPYASLPHVAPDNIEAGSGRLLPCSTAKDLRLISGKYKFESGDVLYSKIRPYLNKVALATFAGTCSADMYVLRGRQGQLLNEYLYFTLLSADFLAQATSHQSRTGIPKINREQISSTELLLPPLAEQRRIVRILSTIQRTITLAAESARAIKCLKVAFVRHHLAFPGSAAMEEHLRDLTCTIETGPFGSQLHADEYVDHGVRVLNPTHLGEHGVRADVPAVYVSEETAGRLGRHRLLADDVVVPRRGNLNRCALARGVQ